MDLKKALLAGVLFGTPFALIFILLSGLKIGLFFGVLTGAAFGGMLYLFANSSVVKQQTHLDSTQEPIIHSGGANHFMNGESVGGKLYLLEKKLIFKSHHFNVNNHEWSIPLSEIQETRPLKKGMIPVGLELILHDGTVEQFVVGKKNFWIQEINRLKK